MFTPPRTGEQQRTFVAIDAGLRLPGGAALHRRDAPKNALFETFADFIPSRLVLTLSAPLAGFHYNEWNLFASPMTVMLTLVILACYVGAAQDRRDRSEAVLFGTVAVFVVVAQLVFLARGHTFVHPWDGAEIMELIMDIGLAVFTLQTTARLIARYGQSPQAR